MADIKKQKNREIQISSCGMSVLAQGRGGELLPSIRNAMNLFGRLLIVKSLKIPVYVIALFVIFYSWEPLINAKWSIIDDHEIMSFIGDHERLPFSRIIPELKKTEVVQVGKSIRYRPVYYIFRLLESAVWGKNPRDWYILRILISALFAITITIFFLQLGGAVLTSGFIVFVLSSHYWSDVFARLGPSEVYAVMGVSLVILGMIRTIKASSLDFIAMINVLLGITISAGSKENLIFLGVIPFWFLFSKKIYVSPLQKKIFIALLVYLAIISSIIINGLSHSGHDIYMNKISLRMISLLTFSFFSNKYVWVWLCGGIFLLLILLKLKLELSCDNDNQRTKNFSLLKSNIILFFLMFLIYYSQYIFYSGKWPDGVGRYQFPGVLSGQIALFIFICSVVEVARCVLPQSKKIIIFLSMFISIFFIVISIQSIEQNRFTSIERVKNSTAFTNLIKSLTFALLKDPSQNLVLFSHQPMDSEPMVSVTSFLRASGVSNPIMERITYSSKNYNKLSLEYWLSRDAEDNQSKGNRNFSFSPFDPKKITSGCISIGFSGPYYPLCNKGYEILSY